MAGAWANRRNRVQNAASSQNFQNPSIFRPVHFNHEIPDPLSKTVGVASLVDTAAKLFHTVNTYRSQYNSQDLSAISIKVQCDCIFVALAQIQAALLGNQHVAARLMCEDSCSGLRLKSVLGACELTFAVVVGRLSKIKGSLDNGARLLSRREKFEQLWKESDISELNQNISRISDGLNLLLTAFNMKSQLEVHQVLTSSRASIILDQVADDATSIYLSDCNASYISETTALREMDPMSHQEIDSKDFTFDQEVLMTPAYQKIQITRPRRRETAILRSSSSGHNEKTQGSVVGPIHREPLPPPCKMASAQTKGNAQIPLLTTGETSQVETASSQSALILESSSGLVSGNKLLQFPTMLYTMEIVSSDPVSCWPVDSEDMLVSAVRALDTQKPLPTPVNYDHKADDEEGQIDDQNSADNVTTKHSPNPPGHEKQAAISDTRLDECLDFLPILDQEDRSELLEPFRKIILKDPMPKYSSLATDDNSREMANHPQHRHKMYITPTEINISGLGIAELADNAVQMVQDTIESFFLYDNNISTLPKSITNCHNLTYLNLKANSLDKLPLEICAIKPLKTLHVSQNNIAEIPEDFTNLHNLEFLDVAFNCLLHLPRFLMLMNNLTIIYAQDNPFVDPRIQNWQLHSKYTWDAEYSQKVTQQLKAVISDSQCPRTSYPQLPVLLFQTKKIQEPAHSALPWLSDLQIGGKASDPDYALDLKILTSISSSRSQMHVALAWG